MVLTSKITGFMFHYSLQYLLSIGFDICDGDHEEFVAQNPDKMAAVTFTLKSTGVDVTELDIYKASQGEATEAMQSLIKQWDLMIKEDTDDLATVLVSMHSGSSDYLYAKDIREQCKNTH